MSKKNKNYEEEKLKAGDIITTDQVKDGVDKSKEESTPPASKKMEKEKKPKIFGTARFIKLNSK